jgi:serine/threonine-protein kinase
MVGEQIDNRYRILRKIGEGGMGQVYLAEHIPLGRHEALKILKPAVAADERLASRLRREARAVNRLSHPNIVAVYDFGRLPDGRFYLSMEHIEGTNLRVLLRRAGALPVTGVLGILAQLADALAHAHAQGVLHRDLKPENLILSAPAEGPLRRQAADVLKVLDFGIAKIVAPDYAESLVLSKEGEIFGTPWYMAPELVDGGAASPRSDLYAIGCIAFELLVGAPPFDGNVAQVLHAHLTKVPEAPSVLHPRIPAALDDIVVRCLEKDPDRRFASAGELLAAIQHVPGLDRRRASQGGGDDPWSVAETDPGSDFPTLVVPREELPVDDSEADARAALRDLGDELLSLGLVDAELTVHLCSVRELEAQRAGEDAELEELRRRTDQLHHAARERERPLRLARSELRFACDQLADGVSGADLDLKIRELDQRLASIARELEREQRELTDRTVAVVASRAHVNDRLAAAHDALEHRVAALVPQFGREPSIVPLLQRWHSARGHR